MRSTIFKTTRRGFTLVEALLCVLLLGMVAASIVRLYSGGVKSLQVQQVRMQLDSAARSRMEQLLATNFTSLASGSESIFVQANRYTVAWTINPIDLDGDGVNDPAARRIDVTTEGVVLSTIYVDHQGRLEKLP